MLVFNHRLSCCLATIQSEEDLMLKRKREEKFKMKKVKKVIVTSVLSLSVFAGLPLATSHAAPNQTINQVFSKFGWSYDGGKVTTSTKSTEYSYKSNNSAYNGSSGSSSTESKQQPKQTTTSNNTGSQQVKASEQSNILADQIIKTGEKYLGVPYKYGAPSGQTKLFDCSLFVQQTFKENGISLPRSSRQQAQVGVTVSRNNLKKGDLIFTTTSTSNGQIAHVGIYAGNNKVLHTWGPGGVRYDSLTGWLDKGFVTAKRVINK
jgi:peptidoglycan endopeptidase LytE